MTRAFTIAEQDATLQPQDVASMRWQAVEAFNTAEGLTPMERRLGVALITCMDSVTRECYPSEAYLSELLGVNIFSVKKAKAALRAMDFIDWDNPGGPRHLSRYTFNWIALLDLSKKAKARAKARREERKQRRTSGGVQTTNETQGNGGAQTTNEGSNGGVQTTSLVVPRPPHGGVQTTSLVAYIPPDVSHYITQEDISHHITRLGSRVRRLTPDAVQASEAGEGGKVKGALERIADAPRQTAAVRPLAEKEIERDFPGLFRSFRKDPEAFAAMLALDRAEFFTLQALQAKHGQDAARQELLGKSQRSSA